MDIGRELESLKKRLAAVEHSSRLSSASLDNTALQVRDSTGSLRGILGQQGDGTTAVNIVNGGPPPAPATPSAAPALGGVSAGWDGTFANGAIIPMDWARVEVHASPTPAFTPTTGTLKATIETAQGGIAYIPSATPLYVALLARNTSGAPSSATTVVGPYTPKPVAGEIGIGEITETLISDGAVTTPKVFANAVTTAKLAAGSVDATALKADAITGKTITGGTVTGATVTGGIVRTGATGQRVVLNPTATDSSNPALTVPAVELHSGASGQVAPGSLSAQITDDTVSYPYASLRSPAVASVGPNGQPINSELRLLSSQPSVRGGSFQLDANPNPYNDGSGKSNLYGYVAKDTAGTSALELVCFDGDDASGGDGLLGPGTSIKMSGTQIRIRAQSSTADRSLYITPTGLSIDGTLAVANTTFTSYTPTVTNGGSATFSARNGMYYKLGKMVFVHVYIVCSAAGSGTTGITVSLPSTPYRGSADIRQYLPTYSGGIAAGTNSATGGAGVGNINFNGSGAVIDQIRDCTDIQIRGNNLGATSTITINGWYREA
ncbi:hypothetical protein ACFW9I_02885 [[Kitasatospora] papulosa]|uniref:hypothetical protein n=1 Tax=[Kitasatospora] papulosa TaxID=1464011 RepID=UPI0036965A42